MNKYIYIFRRDYSHINRVNWVSKYFVRRIEISKIKGFIRIKDPK